MLKVIFACASLMLGDKAEGHKWLALASSQCTLPQYNTHLLTLMLEHEESFEDVPRLSTMQAMILFLKARVFLALMNGGDRLGGYG
jgi:hypothetical protein